MKRGENLKGPDGAKGRALGSTKGGKATAQKPAPADCRRCEILGYTSWMQHIGHLGFRAVMNDNPSALSSLKEKIRRTGRPESRAKWKQLGS